jgi:RNA polymerase sigma factor (sigma-70 family)
MDVASLYRLHGAMVLRRARRLLRDHAAAQDIVHDVFLLFHERRGDVAASSVVSWLYVVTTNLCLKRLRSMTTRARLNATIALVEGEAPRGILLAQVRGLLARLPEEVAAAVVYRYVDEMTHAEIAEVMGCSRRHIGNLMARFEAEMESQRRPA